MTDVHVHHDDIELDDPILIEGLPGIGLAGKIVADHLLDEHDFVEYASVHCETIPQLSVYHPDDRAVRTPVRLSASPDGDIVVLSSDVPVSLEGSMQFVDGMVDWIDHIDAIPVFLSGRPHAADDAEDEPELFGVASGGASDHLETLGLGYPDEPGAISGPTGALLHRCGELDIDALGIVVDSDVRFPDPTAATRLIESVVDPLTGLSTDTQTLVEHASEIRATREALARSMQEASQEASSQAQPLRMFQ